MAIHINEETRQNWLEEIKIIETILKAVDRIAVEDCPPDGCDPKPICPFCHQENWVRLNISHNDDCIVTLARQILMDNGIETSIEEHERFLKEIRNG